MKYKDYYALLGVARTATAAEIKSAYRKLAHKYHPDVSKEPNAEDRFKEIAEAYETLKSPDKRAAYDQLGTHQTGQEFRPPPNWQEQFGGSSFSFDEINLEDLFAGLGGARFARGTSGAKVSIPGQDYEVAVHLSLDSAFRGTEVELDLSMPEYDEAGGVRRVPHTFKTRIPPGVTDGQRLRVPGKGGRALGGARNGDLYLIIALHPHSLYRVDGHDLYLDLPVTPWEAVLGTSIAMPTPGGNVRVKVPPGTRAGQQLRLAGRGIPKPHGGAGDLFAIVQISVPTVTSEPEQELYKQLAYLSTYNPRGHFEEELRHEH
jgi:curved DNA-binding protein